jgi:predicted nucleic acid-binding Zn ribbon protein
MKSLTFESVSVEETRTNQVQRAGFSINKLLDACGYMEKINEQRAIGFWESIVEDSVGPEASKSTTAKQMKNGELLVIVSRAAWRHRLAFETPKLIQMLNKRLGSDTVLAIRLG